MPREWNAASYDSLPLPHRQWGAGVLGRLDEHGLPSDARVLDAGCGTGRDAAAALERHPGWRLVLLDGSQRMLDQARAKIGAGPTYVRADLMAALPVEEPVDAVMSVAAFHWVPDHEVLFANLAARMAPGAPLVAECGGRGNVAGVSAAIEQVTGAPTRGWSFEGVEETRARLVAAGFEVRDVRLRPDPFRCEDETILEEYLGTVVLGAELDRLPDDEHEAFVREVRLALPAPEVDYVRLEINAVRVRSR